MSDNLATHRKWEGAGPRRLDYGTKWAGRDPPLEGWVSSSELEGFEPLGDSNILVILDYVSPAVHIHHSQSESEFHGDLYPLHQRSQRQDRHARDFIPSLVNVLREAVQWVDQKTSFSTHYG